MKKSLAALAALAVCGAASAQSTVTLFGVLDAAVSHTSNKGERVLTNPTPATLANPSLGLLPQSVQASRTELRNSGLSSSRLGFRGVEDLGNGLSASFWLEGALNNDDGTGAASGALNFQRRSTVSLAGGFGELRLGRDNSPAKVNDDTFDPFGAVGAGGSLIATAYSHGRVSNAVQYFLPAGLAGVYGNVMYGMSERASNSPLGLNQRDSDEGRYVGGRIGYANGPLDLALAYGQLDNVDGANKGRDTISVLTDRRFKDKILSLGGTWDFGVAKLFGEYSRRELDREQLARDYVAGVLTVRPTVKTQGYLIGVSVPVGAGIVRASYANVRYDNDSLALFQPEKREANKLALGYQHNLSKRTALYATVSRVSNKNGAALTVGGPAFVSPTIPAGLSGVGYQARTSTGYEFGVRHSF